MSIADLAEPPVPAASGPAEAPGGTVDRSGGGACAPAVDVVVPVYNEEADLEPSLRRLHAYLSTTFPFTWRITIADNASTDVTPSVAVSLAEELAGVRVVRLEEKGRGRLAPSARVVRRPKREVISRGYNALLRVALRVRFSDAQCGFKAVRVDRARALLPLVRDTGWFFDTELLVLAERTGLRIHEVPVDWVDDPDSRVDIVSTATADLRGVVRLARDLATGRLPVARLRAEFHRAPAGSSFTGQALRFAAVGIVSTLAYLALYVLLRLVVPALPANGLALLITALANTAANRRFTFELAGTDGALRHHLHGLALFAAGLALSSGALTGLHLADPTPARALEVGVIVAANAVTTALRFVAMRWWVFAPAARPAPLEDPR